MLTMKAIFRINKFIQTAQFKFYARSIQHTKSIVVSVGGLNQILDFKAINASERKTD